MRLPVVKQLLPVSLVDEGMVKRIRGVAFSARVSPQCSNRMVDGARSVLNEVGWRGRPGVQAAAWMHGCMDACMLVSGIMFEAAGGLTVAAASAAMQLSAFPPPALHCLCSTALQLLADVYIFTDHMTGPSAGASPGYGITLVAETTSGRLLAAEAAAALDRGGNGSGSGAAAGEADTEVVPEDIGQRAAHLLLEEIQRGGVVDSSHQVRACLPCSGGMQLVCLLVCCIHPLDAAVAVCLGEHAAAAGMQRRCCLRSQLL